MTEILLLDDDPLHLKVLARTLNGLGYHNLVGCTSAAAALRALAEPQRQIGLIMLDLNMPGVDGVAFLGLLAERRAEIPVVLVSGEDERLVETAARFGASQHLRILGALPKPVWPAELSGVLQRWESPASSAPAAKVYAPEEIAAAILHQELVPFYQPKVHLATGEVAGVETLVRWQHPKDGLVMPSQFIGVAEERGLVRDLTRMVLRMALEQARRWSAAGTPLAVAVNVSMDDLALPDFADFVMGELARAGIEPQQLSLEVTEQRFASNPDLALATLSRLRLRRVVMSIDDFGTGTASLAQLRDLPFNEVKIDGSFVHGAGSNAIPGTIVHTALTLARRLGLRTVAEGVETVADWAWLRRQACDIAQGYFIGRPMPADDLTAWTTQWSARVGALVSD